MSSFNTGSVMEKQKHMKIVVAAIIALCISFLLVLMKFEIDLGLVAILGLGFAALVLARTRNHSI